MAKWIFGILSAFVSLALCYFILELIFGIDFSLIAPISGLAGYAGGYAVYKTLKAREDYNPMK